MNNKKKTTSINIEERYLNHIMIGLSLIIGALITVIVLIDKGYFDKFL